MVVKLVIPALSAPKGAMRFLLALRNFSLTYLWLGIIQTTATVSLLVLFGTDMMNVGRA